MVGSEQVHELLNLLIQSAVEFPDPGVSIMSKQDSVCSRKFWSASEEYSTSCTALFAHKELE